MKTPKYIQATAWWKAMREKGVKALDEEKHRVFDDAIIKALQTPESRKE